MHTIPHKTEPEELTDGDNSNPEILQLILLQYLVLYHPSVWRILERQPWALKIMFAVLSGNEAEPHQLPDGVSDSDQHIMRHFFARSFSHVLKQGAEEGDDKHRGLGLDVAVDLFLERIDRKRSDELFIYHLKIAFTPSDEVPAHLLILGEVLNG